MLRLGVVDIDLGVEFKLNVVGCFFAFRVAGEGEACGLEVDFEALFGHVGGGDCEEDVVLFGVAGGGALGPGYYGEDGWLGGLWIWGWFEVALPSGVVCVLDMIAGFVDEVMREL